MQQRLPHLHQPGACRGWAHPAPTFAPELRFVQGTFVNFVAISYNAANALPFGTIVVRRPAVSCYRGAHRTANGRRMQRA
jgi:hypothetical protein